MVSPQYYHPPHFTRLFGLLCNKSMTDQEGAYFRTGVFIDICLIQEIERRIMPRMTDEEADILDELVTKNPPKVSGDGKTGFFMKNKGNIIILDDVSATWLHATSESTHKTPSQLVSEMIREKIAIAM